MRFDTAIMVFVGLVRCAQAIKPETPPIDSVAKVGHVLTTPAWPNACLGQTDSLLRPSALAILLIPRREESYLLVTLTSKEDDAFIVQLKVPGSTEAVIPVAYELDLAPLSVRVADAQTWDDSVRQAKLQKRRRLPPPYLYGDINRHVVVFLRSREDQETYLRGFGQTVRETSPSFDGEVIAILFGEGRSYDSLFFSSFSRGGFDGRCVHQFYRRMTGEAVGKPTFIPFCKEEGEGIGAAVWAPDDRVVIYHAANFSKICVIPVKQDLE